MAYEQTDQPDPRENWGDYIKAAYMVNSVTHELEEIPRRLVGEIYTMLNIHQDWFIDCTFIVINAEIAPK